MTIPMTKNLGPWIDLLVEAVLRQMYSVREEQALESPEQKASGNGVRDERSE